MHVGAARIAVVAGQDQGSGALQGQTARAGYVVAPDIEGVQAAARGVHVHRDVIGKGAITAGGGVEIEPRPAGAVVERPARRQLGGGEDVVELRHAQVGKPRGDQPVRLRRHDGCQSRVTDRGQAVGQKLNVVQSRLGISCGGGDHAVVNAGDEVGAWCRVWRTAAAAEIGLHILAE